MHAVYSYHCNKLVKIINKYLLGKSMCTLLGDIIIRVTAETSKWLAILILHFAIPALKWFNIPRDLTRLSICPTHTLFLSHCVSQVPVITLNPYSTHYKMMCQNPP